MTANFNVHASQSHGKNACCLGGWPKRPIPEEKAAATAGNDGQDDDFHFHGNANLVSMELSPI
jgi:hypothetical protein